MTYKLNPEIAKIISPVEIVWNGMSGNSTNRLQKTGEEQTWRFRSGAEAAEHTFESHFNVISYKAVQDAVVVSVYEFMEPRLK